MIEDLWNGLHAIECTHTNILDQELKSLQSREISIPALD